jgi:5'-nucleotidase
MRSNFLICVVFSLAALLGCQHQPSKAPQPFTLTIAHLNDTHSHQEPTLVNLVVDGVKHPVSLGGFARLQTAVEELRAHDPNLLLFHAGDAVQGTLYFSLFNGTVDFDALNRLGVDAMTFGNHEFDRGPAAIPAYLKRAKFPFVSCNIDFSGEPSIAPLVKPWIVREIDGQKIAVLGVTTEDTPISTSDIGNVKFEDPVRAVGRNVAALERLGIHKIILLSHLGYGEDLRLASRVSGVDIIVGGHSHTWLGDASAMARLGLKSDGPYPTEVVSPCGEKVLVVQAGQWGEMLGEMKVRFSPKGVVETYESLESLIVGEDGIPLLAALEASGMARIQPESKAAADALRPFTQQLKAYRSTVLTSAGGELVRSLNGGPGPLIADSMREAVPTSCMAILNYGGVRRDLLAGNISLGDVMEVLPFGSTLQVLDLSGAELKAAMEEDIEFLRKKFAGAAALPLPYVSGARYTVDHRSPAGSRIRSLAILEADGRYSEVLPAKIYRIVVNSFVAGGGDGFATLKAATRYRFDTGIIDADAFASFLKKSGTVALPVESRITVVP